MLINFVGLSFTLESCLYYKPQAVALLILYKLCLQSSISIFYLVLRNLQEERDPRGCIQRWSAEGCRIRGSIFCGIKLSLLYFLIAY